MSKPRMGTVNAWDYAEGLADTIVHEARARGMGEARKIEVRFWGSSPAGVAILHTSKGKYAFPFNTELLSEKDLEDFHREVPEKLVDPLVGGLTSVYHALSFDANIDDYKVNQGELKKLRTFYSAHDLDILL